jgi:hypothetical protein
MEKSADQRTPEENSYLGAYAKWVQQTKVQPGIERAAAFGQFRPLQVIDPATGDVHYEFSGQAIKSGASAPASIDFRAASNVAKAFTSGPQATTLTAFRTATDHLDLLKDATAALQNGDVQVLNQLGNRFQAEFGHAAPTNFEAIKTMLNGELASVAKRGVATDAEIKQMNANISNAQSPEQLLQGIQTNQDLINEKANEMLAQYQSGLQGQPVFQPLSQGGNKPTQAPKSPGGGPPPGAKVIKWDDVK